MSLTRLLEGSGSQPSWALKAREVRIRSSHRVMYGRSPLGKSLSMLAVPGLHPSPLAGEGGEDALASSRMRGAPPRPTHRFARVTLSREGRGAVHPIMRGPLVLGLDPGINTAIFLLLSKQDSRVEPTVVRLTGGPPHNRVMPGPGEARDPGISCAT